jgi:hypothetical protein
MRTKRDSKRPQILLLSAVCVFSAAASGCFAEAHAGYPVAVAEVEVVGTPPLVIESYPSYYYEGRTVFMVDGGWYYNDGGHWNRYRREPEVLAVRRQYVQAAPRAREERVRVQPAREERVRVEPAREELTRVQPARQRPARQQPARRQPAREQQHAERAR